MTPSDLTLPSDETMNQNGPQLWGRVGGSIRPTASWLRKQPQGFVDYPRQLLAPDMPPPNDKLNGRLLAAAGHNPDPDMPMQYVPPEVAMFIAAQMGCRLPTYAEWKFAAAKHPAAPGLLPNLRDATWKMQFEKCASVRFATATEAGLASTQ